MSTTTKILIPIKVSEIYPHPDNPRKDLGDISELTKSIRKNGLMQNLTVIPGHYEAKMGWGPSGYTLLIGHRRFAAAKAAGMLEVPCKVVKDSNPREQIAIMLEENMQRSDLTYLEQAQSFQLMLELGDTAQGIAEKTGFSESTIYHRLNIAKLDQKALKDRERDDCYQLTIKDYAELEKVKSIDKRNEILREATNSDNLRWRCMTAVREEKKKENTEKVRQYLQDACIDCEPVCNAIYNLSFRQIKVIRVDDELEDNLRDELMMLDNLKVTYAKSWDGTVYLLERVEIEEKETDIQAEQKVEVPVNKSDRMILDEMFESALGEMHEFVKDISDIVDKSKLNDPELAMRAWNIILEYCYKCSLNSICAIEYEKYYWEVSTEEKEAVKQKLKQKSMLVQYLYIIDYEALYKNHICIANKDIKYDSDAGEEVLKIYNILKELGFNPSTDEYLRVIDGTHELYKKEQEE